MAGVERSSARTRGRRGGSKSPAVEKKKPEKQVAKKGRGAKNTGPPAKKVPATRGRSKSPAVPKNAKKQQKGKKEVKGKGKSGGKPQQREEKKPVSAEDLDKSMDDYWAKSKDKTIASKKLDEDMEAYWAAKKAGEEAEGEKEAAATETANIEEEKEAGET